MTCSRRCVGLAAALVFVFTVALVPQEEAQTTSTIAAHLYVQSQGPAGPVYGYWANTSGHLSAIPGSPFKLGTQIVGSNGSQFFTMGHTLLHSYQVGSDGAIGSQLFDVGFFNYYGGGCGSPQQTADNGAVLDHTGKYIYLVLQDNAQMSCSAYQSWKVNSDGSFTFVGDTERDFGNQSGEANPAGVSIPSILGNETFAFGYVTRGHNTGVVDLQRGSSGELQFVWYFSQKDPSITDGYYAVRRPDASPTGNYVVFELNADNNSLPPQLGVYTVDSNGNFSTTNTSNDMPATAFIGPSMKFSPSGNLLAVSADGAETNGESGIEIYKFNGAAPLRLYKTLLSGTPIDGIAWDKSNHLYAISKTDNKLYVFTVTTTSVTLDSTISIGSPVKMVVVSE